jgi:hypothetical protein
MEWEKLAREKFKRDNVKLYEKKEKSLTFRKNIRQRQIKSDYINEYNRLKGYIFAHPGLTQVSKQHIKNHMKHLQGLFKNHHETKEAITTDDVDKL